MAYKLIPFQSILLQSIASCRLLAHLNANDFLHKQEVSQMLSGLDEPSKQCLLISGIGNPAILQSMLYMLLVIPHEFINKKDQQTQNFFYDEYKKLNIEIGHKIDSSTICPIPLAYKNDKYDVVLSDGTIMTKYSPQTFYETIDYCTHIRNSVAHSIIQYASQNNSTEASFTFNDSIPNTSISICFTFDANLIEFILEKLDHINCDYLHTFCQQTT